MKDQAHFDELARQKLAERSVPFETSDWQDMERLLRVRRRRRAAGWWSTAALLLALAGGAWWAWGPAEERTGPISQLENTDKVAADNDKTLEPKTVPASGNSTQPAGEEAKAAPDPTPTTAGAPPPPSAPTTAPTTATLPPAPTAPMTPAVTFAMMPAMEATLSPAGERTDGTGEEPATPAAAISSTAPAAANALPPDEKPVEVTSSEAVDPPVAGDPVVDPPTGNNAAPTTMEDVGDTASSNPLLPAAATLWSLEARVLGGPLLTPTHYGRAEYDDHSTAGTTPFAGAELRWGDAHFGLGTGLHYASYRDRIQLEESSVTSTSFPVTYNFIAVDTSVMMVIDTVIEGGIIYYVTQQVNTTILVLDPDVDTVTTTTVTQEQFDQVNTVSYLEIPLFFDARMATGRWTFGACAGPTVGFLVGRQGALPGASTDLQDLPFHQVRFGYAARAYVRYGPDDRWSVGFEPTIRGHFGNELKEGDLSRTSFGYGALLSVGFTLH